MRPLIAAALLFAGTHAAVAGQAPQAAPEKVAEAVGHAERSQHAGLYTKGRSSRLQRAGDAP